MVRLQTDGPRRVAPEKIARDLQEVTTNRYKFRPGERNTPTVTLRIANAAGFWGDDISAPRRLVETSTIDYLTLEYLAELTMSILAHLKSKDPHAGFATDVLTVMRDILPALHRQPQLRVVTNAGGMNPGSCATAVSQILVDAGLGKEPVAVVRGDDLLPHLVQLQATGCSFTNLDTGKPLRDLGKPVVSANAYLGASSIVEALEGDARLVITGRVADASLTVGPLVHRYGWRWDQWDKLGAATVVGHLIECGAQVTGGYSDRWRELDYVDIGYPIAEVEADGSAIITKPVGSGGIVDRRSVAEQLLYEIGNPAEYYTPDVIADFRQVEVEETEQDRVRVRGATGKPAPDSFKVSLAYQGGYTATAQLLVVGPDAADKGRFVAELILKRLAKIGISFQQSHVECLGAGRDSSHRTQSRIQARAGREDQYEVVLRLTVRDSNRAAVERFTQEIAPLITNGPSGITGYASGRPAVRPVLAYWPTLVPKSLVKSVVEIGEANTWVQRGIV